MQEATARLESEPASDLVRHALAPHAPYSVSPALFGLIRAELQHAPFARSSVHLGESAAEIEFLKHGTGPWREGLEQMGKWDPSWVCPRSGPVEYLDRMGFLDDRVLVVHGVHLTAAELKRLAAIGVTLVTCPRGNMRTGAGEAPIEDFFASGMRVAVGTDSLASVPDLNLFSELEEMRRLAPALPARMLLESATINGARALGFEADFGTIDSGKRDALIAVQLNGYVPSVEEYLVSGVDASQITLDSGVMIPVLCEHGALASVLVKHARDAFVSDSVIASQWKQLNFSAPPDFSRALSEYDRFLEIVAGSGCEIVRLLARQRPDARLDLHPRCRGRERRWRHSRQHGQSVARGRASGAGAGAPTPQIADCRIDCPSGPSRRRRRRLARSEDAGRGAGRPHQRTKAFDNCRALLDDSFEELIVVPLPDYPGQHDVMHLMSLISPVDRDLAVIYSRLLPDAVSAKTAASRLSARRRS